MSRSRQARLCTPTQKDTHRGKSIPYIYTLLRQSQVIGRQNYSIPALGKFTDLQPCVLHYPSFGPIIVAQFSVPRIARNLKTTLP